MRGGAAYSSCRPRSVVMLPATSKTPRIGAGARRRILLAVRGCSAYYHGRCSQRPRASTCGAWQFIPSAVRGCSAHTSWPATPKILREYVRGAVAYSSCPTALFRGSPLPRPTMDVLLFSQVCYNAAGPFFAPARLPLLQAINQSKDQSVPELECPAHHIPP